MRPAIKDLPVEVLALSAVSFAVALGYGVVAPAIPVFARDFGVSTAAASAVVSVFAFVRFVSALGSGRMVDRLGERLVLAGGIGIVAVSSALAGLAQSYVQLIVLRGVGGLGSAMFTVSAMNLLLRVVSPDLRGRAAGLYQAGFLVGGITGPALGGLLVGVSIRAPFFVYAGTLVVAGTIAGVALRNTPLRPRAGSAAAEDPTQAPTRLGTALRHRGYLAALAANLGTGWAVFGVRSALVPLFVVEALHRGALWAGVGFVVSSTAQVLLLWPSGRLADVRGRRPALLLGTALAGLAMATLALSNGLALFLVAMAVLGAGSGLLSVAPAAIVGDVIGGRGGTPVAAYQMASDLGSITGPLVAGWLADTVSFGAAFGSAALVLVPSLFLAAAMPETLRAAPRTDAEGPRAA